MSLRRRGMMNDEIASMEGRTPIKLEECKGSYFYGLNLYGWSAQEITTGAQLLNNKATQKIQVAGLSYTYMPDGAYTLSGTPIHAGVIQLNQIMQDHSDNEFPVLYPDSGASYIIRDCQIWYREGENSTNNLFVDAMGTTRIVVFNEAPRILGVRAYYDTGKTYESSRIYTPMISKTTDRNLPYEPYTGGKSSPSPEYPQKIVSAGTKWTTGAQLIDFSRTEFNNCNLVDIQTGAIKCHIDNTYYSTIAINYLNDYLLANRGKTFTFSADNNPTGQSIAIVIYGTRTSGQSFQEKSVLGSQVSITVADDFTAIRNVELRVNRASNPFTDATSVITGLMFCEGDAAKPFEPYTGGIPALVEDKIDVTVRGKNLYKFKNTYDVQGSNRISIPSGLSGKLQGKQITLSAEVYLSLEDTRGNPRINITVELNGVVQAIAKTNIVKGEHKRLSVTMDLSAYNYDNIYVRLTDYSDNSGGVWNGYVKNVMLEIGDIATAYESYHEPQSLTIPTSNGLPGIPVKSGGNYTDAGGQQWICDEVDFGRGAYVKRVHARKVSEFSTKMIMVSGPPALVIEQYSSDPYPKIKNMYMGRFFDFAQDSTNAAPRFTDSVYENPNNFVYIGREGDTYESMHNRIKDGTIQYVLANPIEIPLTPEELSCYQTLHTNTSSTVITNDSDIWMHTKYLKSRN